MNKNIIIILFVICHLTLVITAPAVAMHFEGGGTEIWLLPNSGSSVDLDPGPGTFQDIKGYPVGSPFTDGSITIEVGLGYLLGGEEEIDVPFWPDLLAPSIMRDGADIKVTWEASFDPNPDIYVLVGNGTGMYSNVYTSWQPVIDLVSEFDISGFSGGEIKHLDQVGTGHPEVYYKILPAGTIPTADYPEDITKKNFEVAKAVGKVNVSLQGESENPGKNLISVPFYSTSPLIKDVFGEGPDTVWEEGDMLQYKFAASPAYLSAIYVGDAWKDAANTSNEPQFNADYEFGNWLIIKGNKDITLVGKVININVPVAIYDGSGLSTGGKTMLGMVYPVAIDLTGTSLILDGALEGDLMQYKISPLSQAYISAVVVGGEWKNAADTSQPLDDNIGTLKTPNSYIYVRYENTGFTWNRVKP